MENNLYAYIVFCMFIFFSCNEKLPDEIQEMYNDLPEQIDFNTDVKPIISDKCFACHGPDKAKIKGGLQLHTPKTAYKSGDSGKRAIIPGNSGRSEMVRRILSHDPEVIMPNPKSNLTLTDLEKAILVKWIETGAEYKPHWAFIKPENPKVPDTKFEDWETNDIDAFIAEKLEEKDLSPSKEEERSLLLRRLSLDLTGLPPSPEEINEFERDSSPAAYEKQVDRLLESPHFGEKMAMDWMDVSRYADTHGYTVDRYRDMSPWRTWVIEAFNNNMPYDQFFTWQIAGDLLPNPTKDQLLATGYNRLHPQNMEGGIIDEEFRVEYVVDRASVLGQGAMAMTMGCARCHDHKYDPISQKEFYEFYSFFNNVNESGQISFNQKDIPVPTLMLPDESQEKLIAYLKEQNKQKEEALKIAENEGKRAANAWIAEKGYKRIADHTGEMGASGLYWLEGDLKNQIDGKAGKMDRTGSNNEKPNFVSGRNGKVLKLDGDARLNLSPVGIFKRNEPFSIGIWVNLPDSLKEGVIFHKNDGAKLYNYKGYHLYLRNNKLELALAHTLPDNAIEKHSKAEVPRNQWIHLAMTYDGSSKAEGLKLFLDGEEMSMDIINDNLYKDIIYNNPKAANEPGLKIGGRWRGYGIKGAKVDDIMVFDRNLSRIEIKHLANKDISSSLNKDPSDLSHSEKQDLEEYYIKNLFQAYKEKGNELKLSRQEFVDEVEKVKEVMIMKEMVPRRKSYVLNRGLYSEHGEEVSPNTPKSIMAMPEEYPKNRLGLARWLFHPEHPLTARVAVNRYWQNLFGRGIVETSEDFGNQGALPSHPELLDYLAVTFRESGWDLKALVKLMVMSATYRQSSLTGEKLREKDPDNIYLARGPKVRLSSEMIRDNALAASGLINRKLGGESVKPYQPEGLWSINGGSYQQDSGDKLYRRSLYTLWKRTVPNPSQSTFDQPDRSECTVRRQKTNTPLQALVLLNDPTFVEAAKKLGEEMAYNNDISKAISITHQKLTGRKPKPEELNLLMELQQKEYDKFKAFPQKAIGWLNIGEYEVDKALDPNLIAANAVVSSVIINSDAAITKR